MRVELYKNWSLEQMGFETRINWDVSNRVAAILERNDKFAAGVFTEAGLYSTSLPRNTAEDAVKAIDGGELRVSTLKEHISVLSIVHDVAEGNKSAKVAGIKLDLSGLTPKQKSVMKAALKIPRGSTVSYGELASRAGVPGAARFVGNVMATNRLSPIVPCHRVVSSTGLGGYGGGLSIKVKLLKKEGAFAD